MLSSPTEQMGPSAASVCRIMQQAQHRRGEQHLQLGILPGLHMES